MEILHITKTSFGSKKPFVVSAGSPVKRYTFYNARSVAMVAQIWDAGVNLNMDIALPSNPDFPVTGDLTPFLGKTFIFVPSGVVPDPFHYPVYSSVNLAGNPVDGFYGARHQGGQGAFVGASVNLDDTICAVTLQDAVVYARYTLLADFDTPKVLTFRMDFSTNNVTAVDIVIDVDFVKHNDATGVFDLVRTVSFNQAANSGFISGVVDFSDLADANFIQVFVARSVAYPQLEILTPYWAINGFGDPLGGLLNG